MITVGLRRKVSTSQFLRALQKAAKELGGTCRFDGSAAESHLVLGSVIEEKEAHTGSVTATVNIPLSGYSTRFFKAKMVFVSFTSITNSDLYYDCEYDEVGMEISSIGGRPAGWGWGVCALEVFVPYPGWVFLAGSWPFEYRKRRLENLSRIHQAQIKEAVHPFLRRVDELLADSDSQSTNQSGNWER